MIELQIGGVYRLDKRRFYHGFGPIELWDTVERVMCYDSFEVIVDTEYHEGKRDWFMDEPDKKLFYFGRRPANYFESDCEQIDFSPVSVEAIEFYRLDLPLRISRIKELSWFDPVFESEQLLKDFINKNTSKQWQNQRIDSKELFIETGESALGGVLFKADNNRYFTATEMLVKGRQFIRPKHKNYHGVGIFRSGTKGGIPVYYVGEYYDRAGILKKYEDAGIETNM